jgi:hypothetical protein
LKRFNHLFQANSSSTKIYNLITSAGTCFTSNNSSQILTKKSSNRSTSYLNLNYFVPAFLELSINSFKILFFLENPKFLTFWRHTKNTIIFTYTDILINTCTLILYELKSMEVELGGNLHRQVKICRFAKCQNWLFIDERFNMKIHMHKSVFLCLSHLSDHHFSFSIIHQFHLSSST